MKPKFKIKPTRTYKFKHTTRKWYCLFLSGFHSANVSSCGEIIEEFEDDIPNLKWTFPQISCQTKAVYDEFDRGIFDFQKTIIKRKYTKNSAQKSCYKILKTKN